MTHAQQMLEMHPRAVSIDSAALLACIDACFDCAAPTPSPLDLLCAEPSDAVDGARALART